MGEWGGAVYAVRVAAQGSRGLQGTQTARGRQAGSACLTVVLFGCVDRL